MIPSHARYCWLPLDSRFGFGLGSSFGSDSVSISVSVGFFSRGGGGRKKLMLLLKRIFLKGVDLLGATLMTQGPGDDCVTSLAPKMTHQNG